MSKKARNFKKASRQLNRILKKPEFLNVYWEMMSDLLCYGTVNMDKYNFVFN